MMINLFFTCIWDFYILIGVEYLMPPPYKRISSFHLLITGLALLINHSPKSKPQNFASRKFHKILDDHIILHKTRGGNTSAPSFSASFCSLCTEKRSLASLPMFSLSLTILPTSTTAPSLLASRSQTETRSPFLRLLATTPVT